LLGQRLHGGRGCCCWLCCSNTSDHLHIGRKNSIIMDPWRHRFRSYIVGDVVTDFNGSEGVPAVADATEVRNKYARARWFTIVNPHTLLVDIGAYNMIRACDIKGIITAGCNIIIITTPTAVTWDAWFLTFFAVKIRCVIIGICVIVILLLLYAL